MIVSSAGNSSGAAQRRHSDPPVEDAAVAGREVTRHAGFMRSAMPLRDDDIADLGADRALARDAEHRLGRRVELDDNAVIVAGDDRVEGAFEDPRNRASLSRSAETVWSCAIATPIRPAVARNVSTSSGCQDRSSTQSSKPTVPHQRAIGHDRDAHVMI